MTRLSRRATRRWVGALLLLWCLLLAAATVPAAGQAEITPEPEGTPAAESQAQAAHAEAETEPEPPYVPSFLVLAVIIAASRMAGTLARRLGQPRVLAELLVGLVLGPTLINLLELPILHGARLEVIVEELAQLGVLLLMFIVGLEVHIEELLKRARVALLAGTLGALLPVLLGGLIAWLFVGDAAPALFAGVVLAATSVSISAQVLLELNVLQTKEGNALLATALVDDVLAILLVSITVVLTSGGVDAQGFGEILLTLVRMALFLTAGTVLAWVVIPRVINWMSRQPRIVQTGGLAAWALVLALTFGWAAEELGGVAAITGAFLAGVGISRANDTARDRILSSVENIAYTFLVPIFFVSVGLQTDLRSFPLDAVWLTVLLLLAAVVSKIAGCGLGAYWGGFNRAEALRLGICMISRGEVGLIIAALGISSGVFSADTPLFSALFMVILLTTVLTPPLVRWVFRDMLETGRSAT